MVIPSARFRRAIAAIIMPIVVVLMAGISGGCAASKKFKVDRIHQRSAARQARTPIILIHGLLGAKLHHRSTHETVWGRFMNAIKYSRTEDLALPVDSAVMSENRDELVPYALYESVAGVEFYGAILETLRDAGGYRVGDINNPKPGDSCFIYVYDWRRDNVESAIGLGRAIRQIKTRLGDPDLRFDILAHSMGGLIAEYYLKYGATDVLDDPHEAEVTYAGARDINRLILVGTPLRGTMSSFEALNIGISRTVSPEALFTMPSMYQLLPHDGPSNFVDPEGETLDVDLFDAETWVRHGWSVFNPRGSRRRGAAVAAGTDGAAARLTRNKVFLQAALDRAGAFHTALERESGAGSPVPLHIFGSDCIPTLDRAILKETSSGPVTIFDDETTPDRSARKLERLLLVPGDGTVTAGSLLALDAPTADQDFARTSRSFTSTYFFCESHGMLPSHRGFQNNLFNVLFHSPARSAQPARVVDIR